MEKESKFIDATEYLDTFSCDYLHNKKNSTTAGIKNTVYTYDHAGRVTSITNADGSVYKTTYDFLGKKTSAIDPKGNVVTYTPMMI